MECNKEATSTTVGTSASEEQSISNSVFLFALFLLLQVASEHQRRC
uniref:Uncharacterized protein n=1 Tax=Nelumbo nucifera TaxID=4432 RepID=A0A822Y6E1_NELNU|nr:TPA_asm: hypothetical protein HUJ06_028367 [Nelumbo nucifera]